MEDRAIEILIIIGVLVVLFLVLRELVCWYYKVNERIELQKDSNTILRKILSELKDVTESLEKNKAQENQELFDSDEDLEGDEDL